MNKKQRFKLYSCVFFVAILLVLNIGYRAFRRELVREEINRYQFIALNEANYISSCIDKVVVRTYTLREMISEHDGETDFFDYVADAVYQSVQYDTKVNLRNIAVAPSGVVSKVYPLSTNESLIGFNFTDLSKPGNKEAMEAYENGKTIVTNPFPLIQGGTGMAARTPVYIKKNGNKVFWGLVTATMDFDDLLGAFHLDTLDSMNVNYRLWYKNENGETVVLKQTSDKLEDAVSTEFSVFNIKWNIDLKPQAGWYNPRFEIVIRIVLFIAAILLTVVLQLTLKVHEDGNKMRELAEQDSLTHCYSRYYLNSEILDLQTGNWKNNRTVYSVALIDVDFFKQVNDKYGHFFGDRVLIAVAAVLKDALDNDPNDCLMRYGGDEFVLYFNKITYADLEMKLKTIIARVHDIKFDDAPELKLSLSIGAVCYDKEKQYDYKDIMQTADENLYKVKESGRNGYYLS